MDQLHRVEQCGTGQGQLHIKRSDIQVNLTWFVTGISQYSCKLFILGVVARL